MSEFKGFIEVTALSRVTRWDEEGFEVYDTVEDKVFINIEDVARLQFGGILLRTPFRNGENQLEVKETYEEIKQLIKSATEG